MKLTLLSSLAVAAALLAPSAFAVSWKTVAPKGNDYCHSGISFQVVQETQANRIAADLAKVKFCRVVEQAQ